MTVTARDFSAVPLLAALDAAHLERLAEAATRRTLRDGEALFESGEPATAVFALLRGRLVLRATSDARSTIVMTAEERELLGWTALAERARWLTTGRAAGGVEVIVIPVEAVLDVVAAGGPEASALVQRLFALAASHLAATQSQLLGRGGEGVITGG